MTLFVPTDDAFRALPPNIVTSLTSNIKELRTFLLHHVIASTSYSRGLTTGSLNLARGGSVRISVSDRKFKNAFVQRIITWLFSLSGNICTDAIISKNIFRWNTGVWGYCNRNRSWSNKRRNSRHQPSYLIAIAPLPWQWSDIQRLNPNKILKCYISFHFVRSSIGARSISSTDDTDETSLIITCHI